MAISPAIQEIPAHLEADAAGATVPAELKIDGRGFLPADSRPSMFFPRCSRNPARITGKIDSSSHLSHADQM